MPLLHPPNGTCQPPPLSHPSQGGRPYSSDLCRQILQIYFDNCHLSDLPKLIPSRVAINSHAISLVKVRFAFFMQLSMSAPSMQWETIMRLGRYKALTSSSWLSIVPFSQRPPLLSTGHIYMTLTPQKTHTPVHKSIDLNVF
jgi:hypothetical protein